MIEADRFVEAFHGIVGNYFENGNRESCFLAVAEKQDGEKGPVCAYSVYSEGSVPVTVNAVSRALGELVGSTVKDAGSIASIAAQVTMALIETATATYEERVKRGEAPAIEDDEDEDDEEDEGFITGVYLGSDETEANNE